MDRTTTPPSPQPGDPQNPGGFTHLPALDGVRGLAILLVLCFHLFWSNSHTGSRLFNLFANIRISSYIGVNLFFVLSGFLITGILLDTLHTPHYFKTFYARRALRIFPLYYGVIVVLLLLTHPLHFLWNGWQYFFLTYTVNLAFWRTQPLILPHFNINHFWSLQVEEQFYLLWPFLISRIKRPHTIARVSLLACAAILLLRIALVALRPHYAALHFPYWMPYSTTFSCADNLLFGCTLCALLRTSARERILALAPRIFAISAALLVLAAAIYHGLVWERNVFVPTLGFTLIGIACAALVAMSLRPASTTQRLFQSPTLRFFGRYSYGLYVFHYSLDQSITPHIRRLVDAHFHSKALAVLAGACVVLTASILLALLSYHLYEAPFLKLKRYFPYNRPALPLVGIITLADQREAQPKV
jgi:peptidoglycan/LPS O-acetylase OafA/YrhL